MGHEVSIIKNFTDTFEIPPSVLIKAPGRVNLIGEHTDYNGLPVLPISIPYTITVAASPRPDRIVTINNVNSRYTQNTFELSSDIPHSETGDWSNYVKAAVAALVSHIDIRLQGMNALFHGDIPHSAGLSSSSALVIASALALLATNHYEMEFLELAELMAHGEHYVGTQGGGMDQAICLFGRKGYTVKIDFFPLQYAYVPFPDNYSVIVAHSLVRAAKTENALFLYNRRPAECRLATALINGLYKPDPPLKRLGDLSKYQFFTKCNHSEQFINQTFPHESYSLSEISRITGENTESLTEKYLLTRQGVPMPVPPEGFLIRRRALHILSEAQRVENSCIALKQNDAVTFGELMDESHRSCDENYGISTPELNTLVSIMRENGALGSRLTGAGFGGCAVGLARNEDIEKLLTVVEELYYNSYIADKHPELLGDKDFDNTQLFAVKPAQGAIVTEL